MDWDEIQAEKGNIEDIINVEEIRVILTTYKDGRDSMAVLPNKEMDTLRALGALQRASFHLMEEGGTTISPHDYDEDD